MAASVPVSAKAHLDTHALARSCRELVHVLQGLAQGLLLWQWGLGRAGTRVCTCMWCSRRGIVYQPGAFMRAPLTQCAHSEHTRHVKRGMSLLCVVCSTLICTSRNLHTHNWPELARHVLIPHRLQLTQHAHQYTQTGTHLLTQSAPPRVVVPPAPLPRRSLCRASEAWLEWVHTRWA